MPQKYGPKPNTRRKRGYRRRDLGKHHKSRTIFVMNTDERPLDKIPKDKKRMRRYVFMFNAYMRYFDLFRDRKSAIDSVSHRFGVSSRTVENAIAACRQLLEVKQDLNAAAGFV